MSDARDLQVMWLRGFARALAGTLVWNHDSQAVEGAMRDAGLTLEELKGVVIEQDYDAIATALARRVPL